jgi:putative peptidoglycan binding protein
LGERLVYTEEDRRFEPGTAHLVRRALKSAAVLAAAASLFLPAQAGAGTNPLRGNGMWIWYLNKSSHGNVKRIAKKAHHHHIRTVYVKSSDSKNAWSQFSHRLVHRLHAHHLKVCAWQFVYGTYPKPEARRGAGAIRKGADCLIVDAEANYEGHYAQADRFVDKLHHLVKGHTPIGLSSFPYVDYHPAFPYSVFLGKHGARFNVPQVYWHSIGTSVPGALSHTYRFNRVYRRPIFPTGQTYANPPLREIRKFRRYSKSYGFGGLSWWDWQETGKREWRVLHDGQVRRIAGFDKPTDQYPILSRGSAGDLVVMAQERLRRAHRHPPVNGQYRKRTVRAVKVFQRRHNLGADGVIGPRTWRKLLDFRPVSIDWSHRGNPKSPAPDAPSSASLPPIRNEIPPPGERR